MRQRAPVGNKHQIIPIRCRVVVELARENPGVEKIRWCVCSKLLSRCCCRMRRRRLLSSAPLGFIEIEQLLDDAGRGVDERGGDLLKTFENRIGDSDDWHHWRPPCLN